MSNQDPQTPEVVPEKSLVNYISAFVATLLTGITISTWSTVSNSSQEIVRLQEQIKSVQVQLNEQSKDRYTAQDANKDLKSLERRIEIVEARTDVSPVKAKH